MCHAHAEFHALRQPFADFQVGPNLTTVALAPDYARQWLADPTVLTPATKMPNLNLSAAEIEALVIFLKTEP
jgi:cytochrome c1